MKSLREQVVEWTRNYLNSFGGNTKAIIGISGGKDSSICAAICVEAVGKDRVIGVLMPQGSQHDIDKAQKLVHLLGIKSYTINIGGICSGISSRLQLYGNGELDTTNSVFYTNMPARIRMVLLYSVAGCIGDARVVNTCNRSEDYVGYSTKFGDGAGDFSPLSNLCVREVLEIGHELQLPDDLVYKVPEDGLSGKSDEDNLGFSYAELDAYLLDGVNPSKAKLDNIETRHRNNLHKLLPMPAFVKEVEDEENNE